MKSHSSDLILDAAGIAGTLKRLATEIRSSLPDGCAVAVIGVRRRGEVLAQRLVDLLQGLGARNIDHGSLDITLYRDDLAELGPQAIVRSTEIDFDLKERFVILVDDVLYTGRSVRAALDALVDLGRPRAIQLAVLIDRPGRELPIQADFVGVRLAHVSAPVNVRLNEVDGTEEVRIG